MFCLCLEWILVVLFEGFLASGTKTLVPGMVGQNITLPCDYSTEKHGIRATCWGRGSCSLFSCPGTIVQTDGQKVTFRKFSMYQLMGNIHQGDVALTIMNVTKSARGIYCCRVHIRGWNNDLKTNVEVIIEKGRNSDPITEGVPGKSSEPITEGVPATTSVTGLFIPSESTWTPSTESLPDDVSTYFPTQLKEQRKPETSSGLYIGIGIAVILLLIISGVILLLLKWYLPKNQKIIIFTRQTEPSATGGIQHTLESRIHMQENIYECS